MFDSVVAGLPAVGRFGVKLLSALGGLYIVCFVALYFAQDRFVFLNASDMRTPGGVGAPDFSQQWVTTSDGEKLSAWTRPAQPGRPTVLYLHGNGPALPARLRMLRVWAGEGRGAIAIDYRGFGASSGEPSQEGLQRDVKAAYDYARAQGVAPQDLIVVGESIGTGLALWLASREPVAGVILDSPYSSIADVAAARYWFFPVRLALRTPMPARDWIGAVRAPVLAMHGSADRVIPIRFGRRLVEGADPSRVTWVEFPGLRHIVAQYDAPMRRANEWMAALDRRAVK